MKKLLIFTFLVFAALGCEKKQIKQNPTEASPIAETISLKNNMVVYGNNTCEMPNGTSGCKCEISQEEDCSLQTDCKASNSLPNYDNALHNMFSEKEIADRVSLRTRITEQELIDALRADGFPVL